MSLINLFLVALCVLRAELVAAQQGPTAWTATPFSPFGLPLAVRSPYLNTWLPQGNKPAGLGQAWSNYWSNVITGWFVAIVIDGQAYELAGDAGGVSGLNGSVTQKSVSFSPTNTSFIMQTGPMDVTLTFLSPIEPNDLLRQSLPFSYMYMTAETNDGNEHNVRMYSDISGEFLLGAPGANVSWQFNDDGTNIILSEQFVQPLSFSESGDHALDAVEYYCFKRISGTTASWQISADVVDRNAATNMSTSLNNTADAGQRLLSDSWPVLGIQIDWGQISSTSEPAVFTLGVIRDPVIQYMLPNGTVQMRSHYYRSSFSNDIDALKFFMGDFERAQQAAVAFDAELLNAGSTISAGYADLLALTARQVLSSIDITLAIGSDGNWNFTDTLVFMKNLGAAGSDTPTSNTWTQSVNTVDTLFTAFPAFLYLNPELAGYLLEPLLKYQDSPAYTQNFAAKNIGSAYPNATADSINTPHPYQLEETANMLIMILAYSQLSGNNTLINSHYGLLQKWGQYLNQTAVAPSGQQWADYLVMQNNLPTNNQTNLALKGIIGIAAMSKIATIAGNSDDASQFNSTASSFIQTWQQNAISSSQVDYFYSDGDNTGLMYNLYADVLLGLNFVPSDVYSILTTYYNNLISSKGGYGIPLMNEVPGLTSVSAMMLSAATVTNNATRNAMIGQVHSYASSNFNNTPFGGYYNPIQGAITNENIGYNGHGINSPTIGGIFSLLVKGNVTVKAGGSPGSSDDSGSTSSKSSTGAIAGGIVGGIAGLALIGGGVFIYLRRRRRQAREANDEDIFVSTSAPANEQGLAKYGLGRGAVIEPFPYSDVGAANDDTNMPMSEASHRLQSPSEVPYVRVPVYEKGRLVETRGYSREPALISSESAASSSPRDRSSHAGEESRSSGELLSAVSGSGYASTGISSRTRTGERQRSESGSSSALLETMINRDRALRDEVENLRREVERIRHGGIETVSEAPPPSYRDD